MGKTGIREHPAALGRSEVIVLKKEDGVAVFALQEALRPGAH